MDFLCLKVGLFVNGLVFAFGSPVAMLQHATSSQSFVFHQSQAPPQSPVVSASRPVDAYNSGQPKYEYKYEVSDHQTGDRKSHWESRDGDRVRGEYSLFEPDGVLRTVEYSADAIHGFNAVVKRNEATKNQQNIRPVSYNQRISSTSNKRYLDTDDPGYLRRDSGVVSDPDKVHLNYAESSRPGPSHSSVGFSVNHVVALSEEAVDSF